MSLGKNIKKLRKQSNMTQTQLGEKLNLAKSTISQYENDINIPSIKVLKKLAKIFQVSIDYLVGQGNNTYVKKQEKLLNTIAESPELYKSWEEISCRKELQKLLQAIYVPLRFCVMVN